MRESTRVYISEIQFNDSSTIDVAQNDIVVFVGPNNAGKSRALEDLYQHSGDSSKGVVVSSAKLTKTEGSLFPILSTFQSRDEREPYIHFMYNDNVQIMYHVEQGDEAFYRMSGYGQYRGIFMAKLSTQERLSICYPAQVINRTVANKNPIQTAAYNYKYGKWLSDSFRKAFGKDLIANTHNGATIPLCIGPNVKLEDIYENEQEREDAYAKILEKYPHVHDQGDGIKSFTGILLYLMKDHYNTFLIDEPESFLHPPQARVMGQIIGHTLRDYQQAFISTHSEEIIKGLLDECPERLKIVRITRKDDSNSFRVLNNEKIQSVLGDPLLKYSNILSGLFHNKVVLCESDSDCRFYSVIENYIKQIDSQYSETLFIHCGGKHRMAKTATALRELNIDVRLIPDIDILNDEIIFRKTVEAFGINWMDMEKDYRILSQNLHAKNEKLIRQQTKEELLRVIEANTEKELSKDEIKRIREIVSTESKWNILKRAGKAAIPAGDATKAYDRMEQKLRKHHIYIVPVGELEGFVKEIGGHGPDWANCVLEEYPDLGSDVYKDVKAFIGETVCT